MIKYLELALSHEVYGYLEELDEINWSAQGNVLNQYLSNTSIGTTVRCVDTTHYTPLTCHPNCAAGIFLNYFCCTINFTVFLQQDFAASAFFTFSCLGRSPVKVPNFPLWICT
jgi:hypothetical protein